MNVDKIRNLTDIELNHQQREMADQLFKMKFQLKMGQTESLKKIRELKKDIARIQTVQREKELAGGNGSAHKTASPAAEAAPVHKAATAKKAHKPAKKAAKKSAAKKTTKKAAPKKKAATEKK